jgi:ribulose-phosphate 3-epimerase
MVLIMSVNPGYGGQSFIETTHERLRELRRLCAQKGVSPLVEVDGGVGANNARDIVAAGADVLVAGSSVFREKDRSAAIRAIREAGMMGLSSRDK